MSDAADFVKLYAKRFAQPYFGRSPAEKDLSPEDRILLPKMEARYPNGLANWLESLRKMLLEANPEISRDIANIPIIELKSFERRTAAKSFGGEAPCIFVDTGLLNFVWRMNKAMSVDEEHPSKYTRRALVAFAIARHAVNLQPPVWLEQQKGIKDLFPVPTITSESDSVRPYLVGLTMEHESFVLAHEIAHVELGHLKSVTPRDVNELDKHGTVSSWFPEGFTPTSLQEFDADARALQICVNAFGKNSAYDLEGCLMMIFQFFRYLLWLEIALREGKRSDKEFLMAARTSRLRQEIAKYGEGMAFATMKHLDWLEETMEPGALDGVELYKRVMEQTGPSSD